MSDPSVPPAFAVDGPQPPDHIHSYEPCGRLGRHQAHVWLTRRGTWCWGGGEAGKGAAVHPRTLQRQEAEREQAAETERDAQTGRPDDATDATGATRATDVTDPTPAAGRHVAGGPPA